MKTLKQILSIYRELLAQFSLKEILCACFNYIPTAGKPTIKGGSRLTQKGTAKNFNDVFQR